MNQKAAIYEAQKIWGTTVASPIEAVPPLDKKISYDAGYA